MNPSITVTQKQLSEFFLNVALVRPVFIWGDGNCLINRHRPHLRFCLGSSGFQSDFWRGLIKAIQFTSRSRFLD